MVQLRNAVCDKTKGTHETIDWLKAIVEYQYDWLKSILQKSSFWISYGHTMLVLSNHHLSEIDLHYIALSKSQKNWKRFW